MDIEYMIAKIIIGIFLIVIILGFSWWFITITEWIGSTVQNFCLWFFCKINEPIYSPSLSAVSLIDGLWKPVCAYCKKVHKNG